LRQQDSARFLILNPSDKIGQRIRPDMPDCFKGLRIVAVNVIVHYPFAKGNPIVFRLVFALSRPDEEREGYGGGGAYKGQENSSPFHETILREQG
jgi:hypothetical protein